MAKARCFIGSKGSDGSATGALVVTVLSLSLETRTVVQSLIPHISPFSSSLPAERSTPTCWPTFQCLSTSSSLASIFCMRGKRLIWAWCGLWLRTRSLLCRDISSTSSCLLASFGAWLEEDYLVQQDDIPEEGTDDDGELIDPEARRKMLVRRIHLWFDFCDTSMMLSLAGWCFNSLV